jgi:hypothetical protein
MKRQVSDRLFFARNPDRRYRFRRPFPGELASLQCKPPAGFIGSVLVEQFAPGVRTRNPITHTTWPCSLLRGDETYLAELAARLCSVNQNAADVAARVQDALNTVAGRQKGQP